MAWVLSFLCKVARICIGELFDGMRNYIAVNSRLGFVGIWKSLHQLECSKFVS